MNLSGKVAIITGAGGGGCGRAIATRFAREGAAVVASDINEAGGLETLRCIQADGAKAAFRQTDVSKEHQVRDLIHFAEDTFGALHVLVNNASEINLRPDQPLEHWTESFQTDLMGTVFAIRFAIDAMRRSNGGAIVNMGSISALWHGRRILSPGAVAYDAAKAGVLRFTTGLAWLAEQENIRVNCLAPGWIASPQVRPYWEALTAEQRVQRGAPSRLLRLDQIADAVVRLATDDSLFGRILVWWSEDEPRLIAWGDPGYSELI